MTHVEIKIDFHPKEEACLLSKETLALAFAYASPLSSQRVDSRFKACREVNGSKTSHILRSWLTSDHHCNTKSEQDGR